MKFSPAEISAFVIAFFSFCLMIMNIIDKIINYRRELQRPEIEQNTRIDNLEHRTAKIESKLDNDNRRLNTLEESNRVMLRGMSALLSHGINGNNIPEMEKARDELNDFLVSSK
jgi:predicted RNase H-like nuclease (RuvC/YqgF family)